MHLWRRNRARRRGGRRSPARSPAPPTPSMQVPVAEVPGRNDDRLLSCPPVSDSDAQAGHWRDASGVATSSRTFHRRARAHLHYPDRPPPPSLTDVDSAPSGGPHGPLQQRTAPVTCSLLRCGADGVDEAIPNCRDIGVLRLRALFRLLIPVSRWRE